MYKLWCQSVEKEKAVELEEHQLCCIRYVSGGLHYIQYHGFTGFIYVGLGYQHTITLIMRSLYN